MNKMLRIAYGLLKSRKKYDPEIDKKNQEKSKKVEMTREQREIKSVETSRRYQKLSPEAPVSGRNMKKRKVLIASQSNDIT